MATDYQFGESTAETMAKRFMLKARNIRAFGNVQADFIELFNKEGGLIMKNLLKKGNQIGVRYTFVDASFFDMYFEAKDKVYFGVNDVLEKQS